MNIHETAELIGPPSCIIALDWSAALGARPDPGERGEPGWQRRACPSTGRTPAPLRHGAARNPLPSRAARSCHRRPRAPIRSSAEGTATPSALLRPWPRRRRGGDGSRAPPASAGWGGSRSCPAPADGPVDKARPPPPRAAHSAGAQRVSAPGRGSQRRPHLRTAPPGCCRYCFIGKKATRPNKITLKGPNGAFELKMKTSARVHGK